jgi:transposase
LAAPVSALGRLEVDNPVGEIRHLNANISKLKALMREHGPQLSGWPKLTGIRTIGAVRSRILLSTIGSVVGFPDAAKLPIYFGILPRVYNFNLMEHSGRINKQNTKLGRTVLPQGTLLAASYSPHLQACYRPPRVKRGARRAIIALARKFLVIIKRLRHNWVFGDFPRFFLANGCRSTRGMV